MKATVSICILLLLSLNSYSQKPEVHKFKYHMINGLDRNMELYKEEFTIIIDSENNKFILEPNNSRFSSHDYSMMGTFFDFDDNGGMPMVTAKFAAGYMRDDFEYRLNGTIYFILNTDEQKIKSITLSFNADKRYNWHFMNELPAEVDK